MVTWKLPDGRTILLLTPEQLAQEPAGTELVATNGEIVVVGRDYLDDDTRYGYTAFGKLA